MNIYTNVVIKNPKNKSSIRNLVLVFNLLFSLSRGGVEKSTLFLISRGVGLGAFIIAFLSCSSGVLNVDLRSTKILLKVGGENNVKNFRCMD